MNFLKKRYADFAQGKYQQVFLFGASLLVFLAIFLLGRLFPLYFDDWGYSYVFNASPYKRIENIFDLFQSQYNHYFMWGGRTVVHTIAQILLLFDPFWHDLINSLAYVIFINALYRIANMKRDTNVFVFIFVNALIWFFVPKFTSNVLWITGSANYLWGMLIVVLFIYPYYSYYVDEKQPIYTKGYQLVFFLFFGILAGWTNENVAVALIFVLFVLIIAIRINFKKVPFVFILGLIGTIIGMSLMLLAPGNYIRSEVILDSMDLDKISTFELYKERLFVIWYYQYLNYLKPLVILFLFFFISFIILNKSINKKKIIIGSLMFFVAGHIALLVMIASPIFPERALFGIISLITISIGILYANINLEKTLHRIIYYMCIGLILSVFVYDYSRKYEALSMLDKVTTKREKYIEEQKLQGNKNIVFKDSLGQITLHYKFDYIDLSPDPKVSLNILYSKYYGLDSVRTVIK